MFMYYKCLNKVFLRDLILLGAHNMQNMRLLGEGQYDPRPQARLPLVSWSQICSINGCHFLTAGPILLKFWGFCSTFKVRLDEINFFAKIVTFDPILDLLQF